MAVRGQTIFDCDGKECGRTQTIDGHEYGPPEGWFYVNVEQPGNRAAVWVKLLCPSCFRRVTDLLKTVWGLK